MGKLVHNIKDSSLAGCEETHFPSHMSKQNWKYFHRHRCTRFTCWNGGQGQPVGWHIAAFLGLSVTERALVLLDDGWKTLLRLSLHHEGEVGGVGPGPWFRRPVWHCGRHCHAHVEGLCFHRRQPYRHGEAVAGFVDELLQTGWRQDAVQGLRLAAHPAGGAAGGQGPHVRLHRPGGCRPLCRRMWDQEEQMLWRQCQRQENHLSLGSELVSAVFSDNAHTCQLGGPYNHQKLLQPSGYRCREAGAGVGPLCWLGHFGCSFDHWDPLVVQLLQTNIKRGGSVCGRLCDGTEELQGGEHEPEPDAIWFS